jgi:hypothetical protein
MVIQSRLTPPDWNDEAGGGEEGARCRKFGINRDPDGLVRNDTWFQEAEEALPVCNGDYIGTPCPLRASCLHMALVNNDLNGVWGGMTGPQRKWIRRNVPKSLWTDEAWLRDNVPAPDYFAHLGDEDPDDDEANFVREQEEQAAKDNPDG